MKANLKHRLTELEARNPTPRVSLDKLMMEIEKTHGPQPQMRAALEKVRLLEPSDEMQDVEEYVKTGKHILRQIKRLRARASK